MLGRFLCSADPSSGCTDMLLCSCLLAAAVAAPPRSTRHRAREQSSKGGTQRDAGAEAAHDREPAALLEGRAGINRASLRTLDVIAEKRD